MSDDLRKKAEEKIQNKRGFAVVSTVFVSISIILYIISFNVDPYSAYWIRFPVLILGLILLIIYVGMFGFSIDSFRDAEWDEEEILREMARIRLEERKMKGLAAPEMDKLELKELEKLKEMRE
ncbi:MAG: 2TM domain-containing protein [Bacteroidia bacterium]|nr:2TM domain-containing protein [Bacteroidia bacterium]MBT8230753.1 2TM domain-containing protein [Bacteroidia bacterium]